MCPSCEPEQALETIAAHANGNGTTSNGSNGGAHNPPSLAPTTMLTHQFQLTQDTQPLRPRRTHIQQREITHINPSVISSAISQVSRSSKVL